MAERLVVRHNRTQRPGFGLDPIARCLWRHFLTTWLLLCATLMVGTHQVHAQDPAIWNAPAAAGPLVINVTHDGLPTIAWTKTLPGEQTSILAATDPRSQPAVVVAKLDAPAVFLNLAIDAEKQPTLSWATSHTSTVQITSSSLSANGKTTSVKTAVGQDAVIAVAGDGSLMVAWAEPGALVIADVTSGLTHTIALDHTPDSPADLAVDGQGTAHVIWTVASPPGAAGSLHYANSLAGSTPVTVTTQATSPSLSLDRTGLPHLLWSDGERLLYAHGDDWGAVETVADGVGATLWGIAARDSGDAVAAWASANGIWAAHAKNWRTTRNHLSMAENVRTLDLVVDRVGGTHLLWTQANVDGDATVFYMADAPHGYQCAITWPLANARLTAGDALTATTMPRHGWEQVAFFLEPADAPKSPPGWIPAGVDRDGDDGWSGEIAEATLPGRYRPVAVATSLGATRTAKGPEFTLDPAIGGQVAFVNATGSPLRGEAELSMLWLPDGTDQAPPIELDIYLCPEACDLMHQVCTDKSAAPHFYAGHHVLYRTAEPNATAIVLDSRAIPDGRYTVTARDSSSGVWWPKDGMLLAVDNCIAPRISLAVPEPGTELSASIPITISALDPATAIHRVDVFLEKPLKVMEVNGQTVGVPQRLWAGADDTPEDGWHLEIPIEDAWRGQSWRVLAKASDASGNTWTCKGQHVIDLPRLDTPHLAVFSPQSGDRLSGIERIVIAGQQPGAAVSLTAYLEDPSGQLFKIGAIAPSWPGWQLDWDTRAHADGDYRLDVAIRNSEAERDTVLRTSRFTIANRGSALAFAEPRNGATLSGAQMLGLRETSVATSLRQVTFYWRDVSGDLHHIDDVVQPTSSWSTLWDTRSVLDGDYTLVAAATRLDGSRAYYDKQVSVQNRALEIALNLSEGATVRGQLPVTWAITSPESADVTVSIAYSPDNGHHWLDIAEGITATQPYLFDSNLVPDSAHARLRVTARDAVHVGQSVSPRFVVDNHNLGPHAIILSPTSGQSLTQGELVFAWQATDPDGPHQDLHIDLDYRILGSGWRMLLSDLASSGHISLDERGLPTDQPFDLRLTARDANGAISRDVVEGILLDDNHPPIIHLLWPNAPVSLESEAIILWQATDPDGDRLWVDLYYSDNGGQGWLPLAGHLDNTGYYAWQLAFLPPSDQYRLKAVASDGQSSTAALSDFSFGVGGPSQQIVSLLSPRAGDRVRGTSLVRWSTLAPTSQAPLHIELRRHGESDWLAQATLVEQESYLWDTSAIADGVYDLRVTISDTMGTASAVASAPITIANHADPTLSVNLISPEGGETGSGEQAIRWQMQGGGSLPLTATLSLSVDAGKSWRNIGKSDGHDGRYVLRSSALTDVASVLYSVSISDGMRTVADATTAPVHLFNGPARAPGIQILGPWQDGALLGGDTLVWLAFDRDMSPLSISLWQSGNGGRRWDPIAGPVANTGMATLKDELPADRDALIMATATDGLMTTQSQYVVARAKLPKSVRTETRFVSPQKDEIVSGDYQVTWELDGPAGLDWQTLIELSANGGLSWSVLNQDLGTIPSMLWDTTTVPNGCYRLRISQVSDRATQRWVSPQFVVSNADTPPCALSLLSPNGDETWMGLQDIYWRTDKGDPPVDLHYSVDRGATWTAITRNARGGRYTWDTSWAPNCDAAWIRASIACGGVLRQAISAQPVAIANLAAPTARLWVDGDSVWQGDVALRWLCQSQTGQPLAVSIEYSVDAGHTWTTLARNLAERGAMRWDTQALGPRSQALLRVTAYDRGLRAIDTLWQPITVNARRPEQLPPFAMP